MRTWAWLLVAGLWGCGGSEVVLDGAVDVGTVGDAPVVGGDGEVGTALFSFGDGPRLLPFQQREGRAFFQGDIELGPVPRPVGDGRFGTVSRTLDVGRLNQLWPNRVVPFVVRGDLPNPQRVADAIREWETKTAFRFVARTTEADFVTFVPGQGCSSVLGRQGGEQVVTLEPACTVGSVIHEIGHVAGLWHEQSRLDRGDFVTVNADAIEPGQEFNFGVGGEPIGPYDVTSTMHYASFSFSVGGVPTILTKDGRFIDSQRTLSAGDVAGIARLYDARPACSVGAEFAAKHAQLGGNTGLLGACTTGESPLPGGGRIAHFQNGSLVGHPAHGVHHVFGPLRDVWYLRDGVRGPLGYPRTDPGPTPNERAWFLHFERGSIYWVIGAGRAFEVRGAIRDRWEQNDWEKGFLGFPTTNERPGANGSRFTHFEGGSVFWTQAKGAFIVRGNIRAKYLQLGAERSALGLPTRDEGTTPDGVGRFTHFEKGSIYWSPATGAHEVRGAIYDEWARRGWERSPLGYPVSDEHDVPGGRRSQFQRGEIVWTAATGQIVVR